jgi:hypothetical protein
MRYMVELAESAPMLMKTIDCSSMIFDDFGAQLQNRITVKNELLTNQGQSTSSILTIQAISIVQAMMEGVPEHTQT